MGPLAFFAPFFRDPLAAWKVAMAETDQPSFSNFSKDLQASANTHIDWKEPPPPTTAHFISAPADLPAGMKKQEVTVEETAMRRVSKKEEVKETDNWHCVERAAIKLWRSFRLPGNADTGAMNAKSDDGALVVTVPKSAAPQSDVKASDVSRDHELQPNAGAASEAVTGHSSD